jgi:hypothetical protein
MRKKVTHDDVVDLMLFLELVECGLNTAKV